MINITFDRLLEIAIWEYPETFGKMAQFSDGYRCDALHDGIH
jgi:hypothetical protein